jgi:serine/threonine protein kinase
MSVRLQPPAGFTENIDPSEIEVVLPISISGSSKVYRAHWGPLPVIVKQLLVDLRDPGLTIWLAEEIAKVRRISSPFITATYGTTTLDERPCLVSEFLDGVPLYTVILGAKTTLSLQGKLDIALQIASALQDLHKLDPPIVHADLKPHNIFLLSRSIPPRIKLADFGHGHAPNLCSTTGFRSAMSYAAPESFQRATAPTTASDVYSLAIVLFELFFGVRAWDPLDVRQIMFAVIKEERPALPPASDAVPEAICQLIVRCWAQRPEDRPAVSAVIKELEAIGATLPDQPSLGQPVPSSSSSSSMTTAVPVLLPPIARSNSSMMAAAEIKRPSVAVTRETECPICLNSPFTITPRAREKSTWVELNCGHRLHKVCYDAMVGRARKKQPRRES